MKQLAAVIVFLGAFASGASGINLTPLEVVLSSDGPPQQRYYFQDTEKRLGFRIDSKTTVNGSADAVTFRFTDGNGAMMRVLKSPSLPNVPFAGDGPKTYEAIARTFLPGGVNKVELAEVKPDAIAINGWTSLQFVFKYEFLGASYVRSVSFVNFNANEQYVCDVVSRADIYEKSYARGYKILNSLFDLPLTHTDGPS